MRDKSLLLISLSRSTAAHGPIVLRDALLLKQVGARVQVYGILNSWLEYQCLKEQIPFVAFSPQNDLRNKYQLFKRIRLLAKKNALSLVHTYTYASLLPIGAALKNFTQVGFIYSCNESLIQKYKPFWHDFFITRLDQVICYTDSQAESLVLELPINRMKIKCMSAGLVLDSYQKGDFVAINPKAIQIANCIQTFELHEQETTFLFSAVALLNHQALGKQLFILNLFSSLPWTEHPRFDQLKRMVLERGMEHFVRFLSRPLDAESLKDQHLYLSVDVTSLFSLPELLAISAKIPVLLPRISGRMDLLEQEKVGLSYAVQDAREVNSKIDQIISQYATFKAELESLSKAYFELHNVTRFREEMTGLYQRLLTQKERFQKLKN
jgi:hypothetical protein